MKSLLLNGILCVCINSVGAQTTLSVQVKNKNSTELEFYIPKFALRRDFAEQGWKSKIIDEHGSVKLTLDISEPVFGVIILRPASNASFPTIRYRLYVTPGDQLNLVIDQKSGIVAASGIGAEANQPLLGTLKEPNVETARRDTLPKRAFKIVSDFQREYDQVGLRYTKTIYSSEQFTHDLKEDIRYAALSFYFSFKENNKFRIPKAYVRQFTYWQQKQDSMIARNPLQNDSAMRAPSYLTFIRDFVFRTTEKVWVDAHDDPPSFAEMWFAGDTAAASGSYRRLEKTLLQEKVINRYFKGSAAEYLYASLIDEALKDHDPTSLTEIYHRFKSKYPTSLYALWFKVAMERLEDKSRLTETNSISFLPENGSTLSTFDQIIQLFKGKVTLIDMWGTWCAPCRIELETKTPTIHEHFADRGLTYLYITNYDIDQERWRRLIFHFNLEGTHIFASKALTENIMSSVKGTGYPTYIIVAKDGTWELSRAGSLMDTTVLINQIEEIMQR